MLFRPEGSTTWAARVVAWPAGYRHGADGMQKRCTLLGSHATTGTTELNCLKL